MKNNNTNNTDIKFYIYVLRNDANNKVYVGQTNDPKDRFYACQYRGQKIAEAIKQIGWDKFHANLLATTDNEDAANKLEAEYIAKFDSVNNGYNSTYKTNERRRAFKSARRNERASVTMSKTKWYHNPKTGETTRIVDGNPIPKGYVLGRMSKRKIKGHSLWMKIDTSPNGVSERAIAEIA